MNIDNHPCFDWPTTSVYYRDSCSIIIQFSKNGIGKSISVGIGTSMLYWPNIIRKPAIWLPTMLTSLILGPIGVCLINTTSTSAGAGMGSCGLIGQLSVLETMGYNNPLAYISIFIIQIFLLYLHYKNIKTMKLC